MNAIAMFVRDSGTTIPVLFIPLVADDAAEKVVCQRAGFNDDSRTLLVKLESAECEYDPYGWKSFTMKCAHFWLNNYPNLAFKGMDLDVEAWRKRASDNDWTWVNSPEYSLKSEASR